MTRHDPHIDAYVGWIVAEKTDAIRRKRLATALEWLAEGKHRHWRYEKK